jgi:hypothetical protein
MSRDLEWYAGVGVLASLGILVCILLTAFGVFLYGRLEDNRAQTRCRDRGGAVERYGGSFNDRDWKCVGGSER